MTDPSQFASAAPEASDPERPVFAVGVGPGDPRYLTARAREVVAGADVLIGFETVLDCLPSDVGAETLVCAYGNQSDRIETFAGRVADGETGVAALMGDPNVSGYTFLGRIERAVEAPVRVIPGVSSVQVAASRARTPIEESTVLTLHERGDLSADLDRLVADAGDSHLLVLPRPYDWMPGEVAAELRDRGVDGSLDALVCERLTFEDESVTRWTLDGLAGADRSFDDLSVLVVRAKAGEGTTREGRGAR